jgi:PAS domain S-box-containing protein
VVLVFRDQSKEREAAEKLAGRERYYRSLIHNLHEDIMVIDRDYVVTDINNTALRTLGLERGEVVGRRCFQVSHGLDTPCHEQGEPCALHDVFETGEPSNCRHEHLKSDGTRVNIDIIMSPLKNEAGEITHVVEAARNVTDLFQAQASLRESEAKFRTIFEQMATGCSLDEIVYTDGQAVDYRILDVNPAYERLIGIGKARAVGALASELYGMGQAPNIGTYATVAQTGESASFQTFFPPTGKHLHVTASRTTPGRFCTIISDITERLRLEAQLQQAQKMESVGRLAGGVAHDYNNMLGVIIGYAELALDKVTPSEPLHADLSEILTAARRSTTVTRQLLAFARKQTISPQVLDLNATVESMLKMLRRLIGEDIDLLWKPGRTRRSVKMDPSQIDQIMANLCVNARDAINGVGKITIETGSATFDQAYCVDHAGFVPGEFVLLAVSDDGCGMAKETLGSIFEPFFTTKEVGRGTGLGLAMVYGIVKQNNGFINVYSEPGKGTTFRIYLPCHADDEAETQVDNSANFQMSRGETVLVVEDEDAVRNLAVKMLHKLEYAVLAAGTPAEALRLAAEHGEDIDLLITDVVMPQMNGRDLVEQLSALYPQISTLFMSGYTANVIAHRGVLDEGVQFIQKPFSMKELAAKVREVLTQKQSN